MAGTGTPTVAPQGDLDLTSARALASQMHDLAGETVPQVILDLSEVTFIDSVGLGVVLKAAHRFSRQDKRLVIVCPPGPVLRLLEGSGVNDRLTVVDSADVA
jgi:anti-sigma B factor antagonist